ncbi:MAG: MarR family transcriptional regulator [Oscillospiraceae bacterium]|nr:MarR family transcriptional regulator [Oscillospiraceae bacterium]
MDPAARELMLSLRNLHKQTSRINFLAQLSPMEFVAMTIIHQSREGAEKGRLTVSQVGETLKVSMPMASKILSVLEKQGYISRAEDGADRRVVWISLTPTGETVLQKAMGEYGNFTDWVFEKMGEEDIRTLTRLINRFSDILEGADGQWETKGK